eukprot:TRINITY_DN1274_c1_g1_i1.p1 TRINITY_DN1274_c1_g1~~TRINITY_DN1274_c1_g1_i1.p1  ORF type:complete len:214 (-),score=57.12 TRINITY_DN1274_c1_g1_i1:554-1195(-)
MTAASVASHLSARLLASREEQQRMDAEEENAGRTLDEIPKFLLKKVPEHKRDELLQRKGNVGHLEGDVINGRKGYVRVRGMLKPKKVQEEMSEHEANEKMWEELHSKHEERVRMARDFTVVTSVRNAGAKLKMSQSSVFRGDGKPNKVARNRLEHRAGYSMDTLNNNTIEAATQKSFAIRTGKSKGNTGDGGDGENRLGKGYTRLHPETETDK